MKQNIAQQEHSSTHAVTPLNSWIEKYTVKGLYEQMTYISFT